jgi:hypothetical protein
MASALVMEGMAGLGNNPVQGFRTELLQYCITIGSETTFLSALCVIRSPSYLLWSGTFLLGDWLADLGDFGEVFGSKQGNSKCFLRMSSTL